MNNHLKNSYMSYIWIVILFYLVAEVLFNIWAVRLLGSTNIEDVRHLAIVGKFLSSLALSLFLFKFFIYHPNRKVIFLSLFFGLAPISYCTQQKAVEYFVSHSPAHTKHKAQLLSVLPYLLENNKVQIAGIKVNNNEKSLFSALVPLIAMNSPSVLEQYKNSFHEVSNQFVLSKIGSEKDFYYQYYYPYSTKVMEIYEKEYVKSVKNYNAEIAQSKIDAWGKYVFQLSKNNISMYNYSPREQKQVVEKLHEMNIDVTNSFQLFDREEFLKAAFKDASFDEFSKKKLGYSLKPDLSLDEFAKSKAVKDKLNIGKYSMSSNWTPNLTQKEYREQIYNPAFSEVKNRFDNIINFSSKEYQRNGKNWKQGSDAIYLIVIFPLALFLSLLGIVLNVWNVLCLLTIMKGKVQDKIKNSVLLLCVSLFPLLVSNSLSTNSEFVSLLCNSNMNTIEKAIFWWMSHFQPLLLSLVQ